MNSPIRYDTGTKASGADVVRRKISCGAVERCPYFEGRLQLAANSFATSAFLPRTPSLAHARSRCSVTVYGEIPSDAAIDLVASPRTAAPTTSRSRGES